MTFENTKAPSRGLARRETIRAMRNTRYVVVVAEGRKPNPGYEVDLEQSPLKIYPPQYNLVWYQRPGTWPQVVVPYRHTEILIVPRGQETLTVHHDEGTDEVPIEDAGPGLEPFVEVTSEPTGIATGGEAVGTSGNLKFDEAFADALANLEDTDPRFPDQLTTVRVLEVGGWFGGIAGFHHLYVKVSSS